MRKLFYLPGIISLTAFIFLLPYSFKKISPPKLTALRLNVPKLPKQDGDFIQFTETGIWNYIRSKKKINILLDADLETNEKKLELIRYEARKLKYTFDTTTVILIKFSNELPYSEFIKVLDMCKTDSIRRYATFDNYYIIFGEFPVVQKQESSLPLLQCGYVTLLPKKSFKEKLIDTIKPYVTFQSIGLITGWIILVITHLYFQKKRRASHSSSAP